MLLIRCALCCLALNVLNVWSADAPAASADEKIVADAKAEIAKKNFDGAVKIYRTALFKSKGDIALHRSYAAALFEQARDLINGLAPKIHAKSLEVAAAARDPKAYRDVQGDTTSMGGRMIGGFNGQSVQTGVTTSSGKQFDPSYPPYAKAKAELDALVKESDKAYSYLSDSAREYAEILRLVPDHKDFDAAAHKALAVALNVNSQPAGKRQLADFIKAYTPAQTEEEQGLYKYSQQLLEILEKAHVP